MNLIPAESRPALHEVNVLSLLWRNHPGLLEWEVELVQEGDEVFRIFVTRDNEDGRDFSFEETSQDKAIKNKVMECGLPLGQWMSLAEPDIL